MGIRCLIGHDYGDPQTDRDREQRGDEMVVTVREYKECTRCGNRRTISENKEVTSTASGEAADQPAEDDDSSTVGDAFDRDPASSPPGSTGQGLDAETDVEDVTAETDDGVILEDDPEEDPDRGRGEWPEIDDEEETDVDHEEWPDEDVEADDPATSDDDSGDAADHDPWPGTDAEDEGFDAGPADATPADDVEFGGGLTPESSADHTADDEETVEAPAAGGHSVGEQARDDAAPAGIRSAAPGPSPTGQQRSDDDDTAFVCPQCGHTAPAEESSLRPGDICPECRRGYLTERRVE